MPLPVFLMLLKKLEVLNADEYRKALTGLLELTSPAILEEVSMHLMQLAVQDLLKIIMWPLAVVLKMDRYRISAGYLDQEGIIKTSQFKKYTAILTTSFKFLESKKLGLDINLLVTQTNEQIAPISCFCWFYR